MAANGAGPQFTIESDAAVIVLGHSERQSIGNFWATELDQRGIFETIDVVTLNRAAAMVGRASLRNHLKRATVFTHSAGITRIDKALQVVALNPPEPVDGIRELIRRAMTIANDPIEAEAGASRTGLVDLALAGVELMRSPISTVVTMHRIGIGGYSTVRELSLREHDFPAGRAIVHSESDGFGFCESAELTIAEMAGVVTLTVSEDAYHNSILYTPRRIMDEMTPTILPQTAGPAT